MYYRKEYLKRAHREIDTIFRVLFPEHGMAVREEQILLCHEMLDNLLGRNIALCDAGVGIGKRELKKQVILTLRNRKMTWLLPLKLRSVVKENEKKNLHI